MIFSKKRRSAPSEDGRSAGEGSGRSPAQPGRELRGEGDLAHELVRARIEAEGLRGAEHGVEVHRDPGAEADARPRTQAGEEPAVVAHGLEPDVLGTEVEELGELGQRTELDRAEVVDDPGSDGEAEHGTDAVHARLTRDAAHEDGQPQALAEREVHTVAETAQVADRTVGAEHRGVVQPDRVARPRGLCRRGGRREVQALQEPRAGAVLRRGHGSGGKLAPRLRELDRGGTDSPDVADIPSQRSDVPGEGVEPPVHLGEALAHVRVGSGLGADLHPLAGVSGRTAKHRDAEVPADPVTVGVDRLTTGLHRNRAHGALAAGLGQVGAIVTATVVAAELLPGAGLAPEAGVSAVVAADAHRQAEGLVSPRGAHRRGAAGRELLPARGQLLASGGELAAEGGERVAVATAGRGVGPADGLGLIEGRHRLGGEAPTGRAGVGGAGRARLLRDAAGEGDPLRAGRRPVGRAGDAAAGRDGAAQRAEVGLLRARRGGEKGDEHHAREGEDLLHHDRYLQMMAGKRP